MNQQLIFNNDFSINEARQAVMFSCLVAGMKVTCFISFPGKVDRQAFLAQIKDDAFTWEDQAEQAIEADAFNNAGEIWLTQPE